MKVNKEVKVTIELENGTVELNETEANELFEALGKALDKNTSPFNIKELEKWNTPKKIPEKPWNEPYTPMYPTYPGNHDDWFKPWLEPPYKILL